MLSRAEYYLNEKDLDNAARELNQLTGTPRQLLCDCLGAARRILEVQQALEVCQSDIHVLTIISNSHRVIQAEATLASLLVV